MIQDEIGGINKMAGISSYCMGCIIRKQEERIRSIEDESTKAAYFKELCRLVGESDSKASAPVLVAQNEVLMEKYFGIKDDFEKEKIFFNQLMLIYEDSIWKKIENAEDSLLEALKYAQVGNYIDFGMAMHVERTELEELMEKAKDNPVDMSEYKMLKKDLKNGKSLVYMTDNCGEIVMDKLFIRLIRQLYPHLDITVLVRGENVLNDATMEDAEFVGLTDMVKVIGNGVKVAGTPLEYISDEARQLMLQADVMIAKGQGNFESLNKCGLNIYYMFLCKCTWFEMRFQLKQFSPVLVNDRNLK